MCYLVEMSSQNIQLASVRKTLHSKQKEYLARLCRDNDEILNVDGEVREICSKILKFSETD